MEYMRGSGGGNGGISNMGPSMPSMSSNKKQSSGGGDLFGMVSNLFNNSNNPTNDVDDIINNVHSKINLNPTDDNMMETLTVTEDEITSLIEDTADIKLINGSGNKKPKKNKKDTRVLNL